MLYNYTGSYGTIVDSTNKSIAIIGIIIHNPATVTTVAKLTLKGADGMYKSTIVDTYLSAKETMTLSVKLFLYNGDTLEASGSEFTLSGNSDDL